MSQIPTASLDLGYPPWALEFDPYDRDYLVLGGGGGGGQKEVPNKISVLDVSSTEQIPKVSELQISDDSPASLGLLANKDGLFAYAGINSSSTDQQTGTNEHLRSFRVTFPELARDPKKKNKPGKVEALGKATLFSEAYLKTPDSYQRILRLSPTDPGASGNKRIAVIASSLSTPSEIVFFDATNATPTSKDAFYRIEPPNNAEPNDIDLFKIKEGEFMYAYCTNKDIYVGNIAFDFRNRLVKSQPSAASCIHSAPATSNGPRIKYRALRFLSEKFLLVLLNKGSQSELLLFRIYPEDGIEDRGDIVLQKQLPARFGTAVALDTSILDTASPDGEYQVVVAIAAQARDIAILTIDMPAKGVPPMGFKLYKELNDVHEVPMKKIALSSFVSPYVPNSRFKRRSGPFFIRVASISLSNTVVVQSLELQPISYRSRKPRHVLGQAANLMEYFRSGTSLMVVGFMLLVTLILAQSVLDAQAPGQVSTTRILPQKFHSFITRARQDNDPVKNVIHNIAESHSKTHSLLDMIRKHGHEEEKHIVIRPHVNGDGGELVSEVHHDDEKLLQDEKVKKWNEMTKAEQALWKKRLTDAGQWTAGQGETILKSIFFSEVGGAWGQAAMQAILGGG